MAVIYFQITLISYTIFVLKFHMFLRICVKVVTLLYIVVLLFCFTVFITSRYTRLVSAWYFCIKMHSCSVEMGIRVYRHDNIRCYILFLPVVSFQLNYAYVHYSCKWAAMLVVMVCQCLWNTATLKQYQAFKINLTQFFYSPHGSIYNVTWGNICLNIECRFLI